jgi:hypothetical protein
MSARRDVKGRDAAVASANDLDRALLDPTMVFQAPGEVLARADFTREQQIAILQRWAYDARELETATDEGMPAAGEDLLDRILAALDELGAEAESAGG